MKALHLHLGQVVWAHAVMRLLEELPLPVPESLRDAARRLDAYSIAPRYPDAFVEGPPARYFGPQQSEEAIGHARAILEFVHAAMVRPLRVTSASTAVNGGSPLRRWPNREAVLTAVTEWARALDLPGLFAVGVFGSYARGDWSVGSDVDLVVIVEYSTRAPIERPIDLPLERLPVPAEALVYTREEWDFCAAAGARLVAARLHARGMGTVAAGEPALRGGPRAR